MKKEILIIAHFCDGHYQNSNNRFNYIAEMFSKNGFNVELVTSDFSHSTKLKRTVKSTEIDKFGYKLSIIPEPVYKKNISLKRCYSHYKFGKNLGNYLKSIKRPDVIYCAVPSLEVAAIAAKYASKNNIKFIIDVQDLWPEAFKMVFNVPILSSLIYYPIKRKADFIYSSADEVVAVSETYKSRAMLVNKNCKKGISVFLGTELKKFDQLVKENIYEKPENEFWLVYVGTLGYSYDLTCVIDALELVKNMGINIKFMVIGDGPLKHKFESYSKEKKIYAEFKGNLDYPIMVGLLSICDIAVNPILEGAAASILNKVGDYAAAGLPVLNTQECSEYRQIVDRYCIGFNCKNSNAEDLAEKLFILYRDEKLREQMGYNNRKLAEEKFDRETTYAEILNIIK